MTRELDHFSLLQPVHGLKDEITRLVMLATNSLGTLLQATPRLQGGSSSQLGHRHALERREFDVHFGEKS